MTANPFDSVAVPAVPRGSRRVAPSELTVSSWWRELRSSRDVAIRGRFSTDKARKFITYANTTSRRRRTIVICLYPVPGLLLSLAFALIPLKDPARGAAVNWMFFVHFASMSWLVSTSIMIQVRAVSQIDHAEYGTSAIAVAGIVVAALSAGFMALLSVTWRFPTPFSWTILPVPFVTFIVLAHAVVFRGDRQLSRGTRTKLLVYVPSLTVQNSQLTVYPAYSALFAVSNEWQQLVLVGLFPCLKYVLKRTILTLSRHLGDFAREVAGAGVEICASMYQATIMQSTPSPLVTASVIGVDVLISAVEIKRYLERRSIVPTEDLLDRAVEILVDTSRPPMNDNELARFGTPTRGFTNTALTSVDSIKHGITKTSLRQLATRSSAVAPVAILGVTSAVDKDNIVLAHALEILQSAESILLAEYLEVAVPFVSTCYFLVASQLPAAVYNPKLVDFYFDPSQLRPAAINILLYTLLQGLTLAGMYVVMRVRYRLSAFTLLAFVMETHTWSLIGKLTAWMVVILAFPIAHYGVDFTFKFDYNVRSS